MRKAASALARPPVLLNGTGPDATGARGWGAGDAGTDCGGWVTRGAAATATDTRIEAGSFRSPPTSVTGMAGRVAGASRTCAAAGTNAPPLLLPLALLPLLPVDRGARYRERIASVTERGPDAGPVLIERDCPPLVDAEASARASDPGPAVERMRDDGAGLLSTLREVAGREVEEGSAAARLRLASRARKSAVARFPAADSGAGRPEGDLEALLRGLEGALLAREPARERSAASNCSLLETGAAPLRDPTPVPFLTVATGLRPF